MKEVIQFVLRVFAIIVLTLTLIGVIQLKRNVRELRKELEEVRKDNQYNNEVDEMLKSYPYEHSHIPKDTITIITKEKILRARTGINF